MKKLKWIRWIWIAGFSGGMAFSSEARKDEVTLMIVPRVESIVQVGMDIANRYPSLLVSYQLAGNGAVSLHGWTGTQWVNITLDDFASGNFFKNGPDSALIIEKENIPVPARLIPSADWCMNVSKITTTKIRPVLHLVGRYYDFNFKDWQWFATRYIMNIDAINPEGLNISWYHKRMEDHLKGHDPQGVSDLQYWLSIRQSVIAEAVLPAEERVEMMEEGFENPLTNAAPTAVIMSAANASEEGSETPDSVPETGAEDETPKAMEEVE